MSSTSSNINKSQLITTTDLIDAKLEQQQFFGSQLCPGCGHKLPGIQPDWVGLPAGVKFDPTDKELIEHLEAKVEGKLSKSHPLIDEFIPTIDGEDGICYTHPEKLPGVTRDGLSRHFFHRPSRAYTTGTRKRRKIQMPETDHHHRGGGGGETRWHKTGKTRPVTVKEKQIKGCKKILVLYTNFGKNRKPEKTNWVMHQYHLGLQEEEKDGELVVSKIFYQTQPRQPCSWSSAATTAARAAAVSVAAIAATEGGGTISEVSGGRSGSNCSFDKEVMIGNTINEDHRDNFGCFSSYVDLDLHHLRQASDLSDFISFRKSFDDQANTRDVPTPMEITIMSPLDENHLRNHHLHKHGLMSSSTNHDAMAATAFRTSESMSQILCPTGLLDHHGSMMLDDDSFHVSTMMLHNEGFQEQQEQEEEETEKEQHDKIGGRSASCLEEIIMSCTPSSATPSIKQESPMAHQHEEAADQWLKYSSYWHDPDNPNQNL